MQATSDMMVSVLMAVYKEPAEYVTAAVESILAQRYRDFEFIIICDNPQNAELIQLISSYADRDSRIRFLTNEENIGLTKSLNKGIAICRGKYVARMDADDISLPNRLADQVSYLEAHPEITAVSGQILVINEDSETVNIGRFCTVPNDIPVHAFFTSPLCHPAAMIRREVSPHELVHYNENFRYAQDYALWTELIAKGCQLTNLPQTLLKYRVSSNHISSKHLSEQNECKRLIFLNYLKGLRYEPEQVDCLYLLLFDKLERSSWNTHRETLLRIMREDNKSTVMNERLLNRKLLDELGTYLAKNYNRFYGLFVTIRLAYTCRILPHKVCLRLLFPATLRFWFKLRDRLKTRLLARSLH